MTAYSECNTWEWMITQHLTPVNVHTSLKSQSNLWIHGNNPLCSPEVYQVHYPLLDLGIWSWLSCPCVHACVRVCFRNYISDMSGPIFFVHGTDNTWWCSYARHLFFSTSDPRWPTGGHFSCKKTWCRTRPQRFLGYACPWQTFDLFKLGTYLMNDGLHTHVIFFKIRSKMADWWQLGYLNVSPIISQTGMIRFCSNLVQGQHIIAYTCP